MSEAFPLYVIANPEAGSADALTLLEQKLQHFPSAEIVRTEHKGHATELARHAAERGGVAVIAAGGDGTVNEVLNGIAPDFARVSLGVIPLGTGNDFARSLDIPLDPAAALHLLSQGHTQPVDVGVVEYGGRRRYFLNASAGGFGPAVQEKLQENEKSVWGPLSYLLGAVRAVSDLVPYHVTMELDQDRRSEISLLNIVVANARFIAGGIAIAPDAQLDDGKLDVVILPELGAAATAIAIAQLLAGAHQVGQGFVFERASKIRLLSDPPLPVNCDGEVVGTADVSFTVVPRALQVHTSPARS